MSKKLFVGNLPFSTTEDQLHEMFTAHGRVTSATLITDKFSGRSRGFGFVEMEADDAAETAITTLNNADIDGRKIVVNEARPMQPRTEGGFKGGAKKSGGFGRRGAW